jgi:hypothetical protein
MATHTCNQNCGCTNSYTVTAPCPPACSEVFNASCIVYTGTDITCNTDTVIKRYDYLDTVITKLVNYICNTVAPVTQVVGSTYIDVVPNTIGNVTTFTVSVDIAQLDVYFANAFQNDLFASILAGPGIAVATNAITGTVTISHQDTSAVNNLNSDNSGNTFIQDIAFSFDTFGHVTGASVVAVSVTPPNDYLNVQIFPDSPSYVWGTDNNSTDIQTAQGPADTLNVVAGTGIVLNASTVSGTEAIRITNDAPDQTVVLNEGAGIDVTGTYPNFTIANTDPGSAVTLTSAGVATESLVNDGVGPALATKGLKANTGISLVSTATDISITNTAPNIVQNVFTTFTATTGSTTANTSTDTLTVVGAGGITTSIAGDTLTITGSGGGGVGKYIETTPTISGGGSIGINHALNTPHVILSVTLVSSGFAINPGVDYNWVVVDNDNITINDFPTGSWSGEPVRVTVIG